VFLFSLVRQVLEKLGGAASAVEQLLDALGVIGRDGGATVEAAGPLGRLVLEKVATARLLPHDLAGSGLAEPLACPPVLRNRLPAPLWVLALGIFPQFSSLGGD